MLVDDDIEVKDTQEKYLQFELNNESYAVRLLSVREVIPLPETTPLPNSPGHYLGIMNLRGQIISIIDLRKRLKLNNSDTEKEEAVIIVETNNVSVGVIVDRINRVFNMKASQIAEVPELNFQVNAQYIEGVYHANDKLTILLDLTKILNINEITQLQKKIA